MRTTRRWNLCHVAGAAFLLMQLGLIVHARFVPERFFCWAPYDEHSRYQVEVTLDGVPLQAKDVASRYRYPAQGWEPRAIHNIISQIRQYETTYGHDEAADVVVAYQINGHEWKEWRWPEK